MVRGSHLKLTGTFKKDTKCYKRMSCGTLKKQLSMGQPWNKHNILMVYLEATSTLFKIKQEASGWNSSVLTADERTRFIKEYHAIEGILLDQEKVKANPGLHTISKLLLNSLWGNWPKGESAFYICYHVSTLHGTSRVT